MCGAAAAAGGRPPPNFHLSFEDRSVSTSPEAVPTRVRPIHLGTILVLVVGLLITAALSLGAQAVHNTNENRLLAQRVREAAAVVAAAVPTLQTPLASAAVLAQATRGDATSFEQLMMPVATGAPFVSASLWSLASSSPTLLATVGQKPELATAAPATISRVLRAAVGSGGKVTISDFLASPERRLGYAYASPGVGATYVVYTETAFPKDRRATIDKDSAFADLDYALYFGTSPSSAQLVASSTGGAVPRDRKSSATVAFGTSHLLLVMSPKKELGGDLLARLPWGLGGAGLVLTLAGAFLVERLVRRRVHAEVLADENDELYREQRTVAQTLQHSLLPDKLPNIPGLELAARYVAGVEGIDIGGDWYDVVSLDDDHIVFVVGDVSGRGLRAATAMAELRYAVRAYAAQGDAPDAILTKVSRLIKVGRDGYFATAVCGAIDLPARRASVANAGHPDLLLVTPSEARFVTNEIGAPLGVVEGEPYSSVSMTIPAHATLLAYTDGLVERRGENLDVGRERLRTAGLDTSGSMDDMLARILDQAIPTGSADDTAILGFRWLT
jgi:serine phosphatase RsbU (regulator of sigma subunit)